MLGTGETDQVGFEGGDAVAQDLVEVVEDLVEELGVVFADAAGDAEVHAFEQLGVDLLFELHESGLEALVVGGGLVGALAVAADDGDGELADLDLVAEVDQRRLAVGHLAVGHAGAGLADGFDRQAIAALDDSGVARGDERALEHDMTRLVAADGDGVTLGFERLPDVVAVVVEPELHVEVVGGR